MAKTKAARETTNSTSSELKRKKTSTKKKKKGGSGSSRNGKMKRRDARIEGMKPKKPPTAFFYFLEDFRRQYQEQNPEVKTMTQIGKACGQKWKTMAYEEKVNYYDIATQKRKEFDTAIADFNRRMENGEFDESDDDDEDSEFDT